MPKTRTIEIASKIKRLQNRKYGALYMWGHSKEEIDSLIDSLENEGLENVLALRGDPPRDQPDFDFSKNVYQYASQLIEHIKKKQPMHRCCCLC